MRSFSVALVEVTLIHVCCLFLQFGLDQLHIGLVFVINAVIYLLLSLVVGRLSDKFVRKDIYH